MKKISLLIYVISLASILSMNTIASVTPGNSQSGEGLEITPRVQWSENVEGTFSYCVYEGTVTLDSVLIHKHSASFQLQIRLLETCYLW